MSRPALVRALRLAALLLLAGCAAAGPRAAGETGPRAELPTLRVGERWIRSDGIYDLVRIEGDQYVFSAGPNREFRLTRSLGLARVQRGSSFQVYEPPIELRWPLVVGAGGHVTGRRRTHLGPGGHDVTVTWRVEAHESVRVAGVDTMAFRLHYRVQSMRRGQPEDAGVLLWYAPEHRQFVEARSQDYGLMNFSVVAFDQPGTPVKLTLGGGPAEARADRPEYRLTGSVAGERGVGRVAVARNGEVVATLEPLDRPGELPLDVPVPLTRGRNVILVTALDPAGGNPQQAARVVIYEPATSGAPEAPAAPAPRATTRPAPPPAAPAPGPPARPAPGPAAPASPPPAAAPAPAPAAPLRIAIAAPADQQRVEQPGTTLAAVVSAGRGVRRVQVSVNGLEAGRLEERAPVGSLPVALPLTLREGTNTVVVTATDADGLVQQEVRTVLFQPTVPLTVGFRYPEDRTSVSEPASVAAAVVTSSRGVARISVLLNGTEVHQQEERVPPPSLLVTVPLTLREGPNTVAISATDASGATRQDVRTVTYRPPVAAPPPPPAIPARPAPDRWAVIIGVGRYDSTAIPSLSYSVDDAEAVYRVLTGPGGFKKEHVLLLTDRSERKPTLRNVKWALGTFLARSARKEDTVLIYFAGHGAPEVDQRGLERDGLAKYLVPADAEPDDLYSSALPMDELQTIFSRIEAERVVVFLDACYSGAAGGRTFASKKMRAGNLDDLFLERLTRAKGRAIVTAARPSEVSLEASDLGHGIFTYYLVRALEGAADANRDGIVSLQELYEWVEQQVTAKSRQVGGNQHPVMKGELEGVLPLVQVRGRR
jgi:uncharacterized caspase-like protein